MKRTLPLLTFVAGLIMGIACGWFPAHQTVSSFSDSAFAAAFVDLNEALSSLRDLRENRTKEAIEALENRLDVAIVQVGSIIPEMADQQKRNSYIRALQRVRDYRSKNPWTSIAPEVQEAITSAFANLPKEKP